MSNIYIQEPPTNGKVLLITTVGDIDVELWSKEAPKACRNFIQLCLEGYYDETIFHRVLPGFIAQGGDPSGTGHGGESVYGHPFKDEFHSRLRFVRRGLVAMANSGPNDNGSQFFFTLGSTPELMNKHTIFGKVGGQTVYNMIKLQECEIGEEDRPLYPNKIMKTQVLANPFDDIVPRTTKKLKKDEETDTKPKSKSKATKNFSLLSFGEEAEEDEEEVTKVSQGLKGKSKSSHDLANDPKLSSMISTDIESSSTIQVEKRKRATYDEEEEDSESDEFTNREQKEAVQNIQKKLKKTADGKTEKQENDRKPSSRREELRQESEKLMKELRGSMKKEEKREDQVKAREETQDSSNKNDPLADFKRDRQKYKELRKQQGKKGSSREDLTLSILDKFKSKLQAAQTLAGGYSDDEDSETKVIEGKDEIEEEEETNDMSWMHHTLRFDEQQKKKVLDANVDDVDRYEIFDPRNPLTKRRREVSKQTMKGKR